MEDTTIILIIALIGVFSLIGARIFKPGQAKTKQKKAVETATEVLDKIQLDQIERLKSQLKSEAGRANRLQALKDQAAGNLEPQQEIASEGAGEPATWEEIQALCKANYPQYMKYINLPGMQEEVMKQFKGLTLAQVIQQINAIIGGGQSQSGAAQSFQENDPNFA